MNIKALHLDAHDEVVNQYVELIRKLKTELKRERMIVDIYAAKEIYVNPNEYSFGMIGSPIETDRGQFARNQQMMRRKDIIL